MKRKIVISEDGSQTLYVESLNEHYHSIFGAVSESQHIFIEAGLLSSSVKDPEILEIGFGTGLNALLTLSYANKKSKIKYYALEKYPLTEEEWSSLNFFPGNAELSNYFNLLHRGSWHKWLMIKPGFSFYKSQADFNNFYPEGNYDIIYFDAFAPDVQPELWSQENFKKLYQSMNNGGILVTYSVKGSVRRVLLECGFKVEKLPGPKGKRHMLRAYR